MNKEPTDFREIYGRRPKVAIGHPMLGRGGSEGSLMWMIEALKVDCDVTVLTTKGWQLDELNKFYETNVQSHEVRLRRVPTMLPDRVSAAALRGAIFQRFLRGIAWDYDLRISAYNPSDWGAPAIHKLADFSWCSSIREEYDTATPGFAYRDTFLRRAYLGFCHMCERPSGRDVFRQDTTIANSKWSAERLRDHFGGSLMPVAYPPVWCEFPEVPWDEKERSFVTIGRIAPEKRIEVAIEVLKAVRGRGHDLKLHLCGEIGDDTYGRMIKSLCVANSDWIAVHGRVAGKVKINLLSSCRYGIHTGSREAFGIAVAEMTRAGAVVFAPRIGGQAEILDHECLLFDTEADAVEKIDLVLRSIELQTSLNKHLSLKSKLFSAKTFVSQCRAIIADHARAAQSIKIV
jgi:glycosyltransferase involved in cell wall biosynthesis